MNSPLLSAAACAEIAEQAADPFEVDLVQVFDSDIPALLATIAALRDAVEPFGSLKLDLAGICEGEGRTIYVQGDDLRRAAAVYAETGP